jgi:hypothetical protein
MSSALHMGCHRPPSHNQSHREQAKEVKHHVWTTHFMFFRKYYHRGLQIGTTEEKSANGQSLAKSFFRVQTFPRTHVLGRALSYDE